MSLRRVIIDYLDKLVEEEGFFTAEEKEALEGFKPDNNAGPTGEEGVGISLSPLRFRVSDIPQLQTAGVNPILDAHYRASFKNIAELIMINPGLQMWAMVATEYPCGSVLIDVVCNATAPVRAPVCREPECTATHSEFVPGTETL